MLADHQKQDYILCQSSCQLNERLMVPGLNPSQVLRSRDCQSNNFKPEPFWKATFRISPPRRAPLRSPIPTTSTLPASRPRRKGVARSGSTSNATTASSRTSSSDSSDRRSSKTWLVLVMFFSFRTQMAWNPIFGVFHVPGIHIMKNLFY